MDQRARERFQKELDRNFCVEAPAGTGKTRLIARRVAELALRDPVALESLVLVTYTDRAARQMRERIQAELASWQSRDLADQAVDRFQRAFVGTIHSFCCLLIREYAPFLGYRGSFQVSDDGDPPPVPEPWELPPWPWVERLHRWIPEREIRAAAQKLSFSLLDWKEMWEEVRRGLDGRLPGAAELRATIEQSSATFRAPESLRKLLELLRLWDGESFLPLEFSDGHRKRLSEDFRNLLATLEPVGRASLGLAVYYAHLLQEHRFQKGLLYYSDQIILAYRLLTNPSVRKDLLGRGYRILLDEAQDTDPWQFALLTELARRPDSPPFDWLSRPEQGPEAGRFSMVGDAQQSIYRDRASLEVYLAYCKALAQAPHGEAISLRQGYRCRRAIVEFVEKIFPEILTGRDGQALYCPFHAPPQGEEGSVLQWVVPEVWSEQDPEPWRLRKEALWLADKLAACGPGKLGARHWGEIAILAFRRDELEALAAALKEKGIPYRADFEPPYADIPEFWWLAALAMIHSQPWNQWEIAGVLREVYGISDEAIWAFCYPEGRGQAPRKLLLAPYPKKASPVEAALDELYRIHREAQAFPPARALAYWVRETGLAGRLSAFAKKGEESLEEKLSRWLLRFYRQQADLAEGRTVLALQKILRRGTSALFGPRDLQAVHLLTNKKAKGLEWDVVFLAFCGKRQNLPRREARPHVLVDARREHSPVILWANGLWTPGGDRVETIHQKAEEQERQRLAYVACTRARRTLILVEDQALWCRREQKKGAWSMLELLGGKGSACKGLPSNPPEPREAEPSCSEGKLGAFQADPWPRKVEGELAFLRWVHTLPSEAKSQEREEAESRRPGPWVRWTLSLPLRYGLWWHEVLAHWPWGIGDPRALTAWLTVELDRLPGSLRPRGQKELEQLQASKLFRELTEAASQGCLFCEVPYLREFPEGVVEEGKIDLLYRRGSGQWVLLDWKTDQVQDLAELSRTLLPRYLNQLRSYGAAARQYGIPVAIAELYSTCLAQSIPVPLQETPGLEIPTEGNKGDPTR
jgi:ATP-dependent helicase/nuclease subunit A